MPTTPHPQQAMPAHLPHQMTATEGMHQNMSLEINDCLKRVEMNFRTPEVHTLKAAFQLITIGEGGSNSKIQYLYIGVYICLLQLCPYLLNFAIISDSCKASVTERNILTQEKKKY